jgi:hypothetical protein
MLFHLMFTLLFYHNHILSWSEISLSSSHQSLNRGAWLGRADVEHVGLGRAGALASILVQRHLPQPLHLQPPSGLIHNFLRKNDRTCTQDVSPGSFPGLTFLVLFAYILQVLSVRP